MGDLSEKDKDLKTTNTICTEMPKQCIYMHTHIYTLPSVGRADAVTHMSFSMSRVYILSFFPVV